MKKGLSLPESANPTVRVVYHLTETDWFGYI
jgi:hypothetical protein